MAELYEDVRARVEQYVAGAENADLAAALDQVRQNVNRCGNSG